MSLSGSCLLQKSLFKKKIGSTKSLNGTILNVSTTNVDFITRPFASTYMYFYVPCRIPKSEGQEVVESDAVSIISRKCETRKVWSVYVNI